MPSGKPVSPKHRRLRPKANTTDWARPILIRACWPIPTKVPMPAVCAVSNRCPIACRRAITISVTAMPLPMFRPMIRRSTTSSYRAIRCGSNPNTSRRCSVRGARRSIPAAGTAVGTTVGVSGLHGGGIPRGAGTGDSPIVRGTIRGMVPGGGLLGVPDGMAIGDTAGRTTIGSTATHVRTTTAGVAAKPEAVGTTDTDEAITAVAEAVTTIAVPAIGTTAITMAPATRRIIRAVPGTIPTGTTDSITMGSTVVEVEVITAVAAITAAVREDFLAAAEAAVAAAAEIGAAAATTAAVDPRGFEWRQ